MPEIPEERLRQLEEEYDRGGNSLASAAYLVLSAIRALEGAEDPVARQSADRLRAVLGELEPEVFRRLEAPSPDTGPRPRPPET